MEKINVAVVTDDGITVSQHFGRAKFYEVLTIENGVVINRERREKLGHHSFSHDDHQHHHSGVHGMDEASHNRHVSMAEAIRDCNYLISRGMGNGAFSSLQRMNIKAIITDIVNINDIITPLFEGTIKNHIEKLH